MTEITLNSNGGGFPVYKAEPGGKPKSALIVIHEVWGLTEHIKDVADRFADEGYLALAPNLISDVDIEKHMTPDMPNQLFNPETRNEIQPKLREIMAPISTDEFAEATIAKLKACVDYLGQNIDLADHIGVVGFCFGGTYAFQLAINEPRLKAAVAFYGHANFSANDARNITCPILAFYGERDENLVKDLPDLENKMHQAGVSFESVVYENCGHAFFNDTNPYAYNEKAAQDAWTKTLKFLTANLN